MFFWRFLRGVAAGSFIAVAAWLWVWPRPSELQKNEKEIVKLFSEIHHETTKITINLFATVIDALGCTSSHYHHTNTGATRRRAALISPWKRLESRIRSGGKSYVAMQQWLIQLKWQKSNNQSKKDRTSSCTTINRDGVNRPAEWTENNFMASLRSESETRSMRFVVCRSWDVQRLAYNEALR